MTFPENIEKKKDKNLFPLSLQQVSNESQCLVREKKISHRRILLKIIIENVSRAINNIHVFPAVNGFYLSCLISGSSNMFRYFISNK